MILYHYTAREYLTDILAEGLMKGDVPTSPTESLNAVWLTSDPNPNGHGLSRGGIPTLAERVAWEQWTGERMSDDARFPNKRAVRITVRIPSNDRKLAPWLKWSRRRLDPAWLKDLHSAAGGGRQPRTWYLYFGIIPPSAFQSVHHLDATT